MLRTTDIVLVSILASLSIACGSGSKAPEKAPSLTVAPTEWSVSAGGEPKQFTATLTDSSDPISWIVETAGTAAESVIPGSPRELP